MLGLAPPKNPGLPIALLFLGYEQMDDYFDISYMR